MRTKRGLVSSAAIVALAAAGPLQACEPEQPTFTIEVVGVSPVLGTGIQKDRVPANVQTITHEEIEERRALSLSDLFNQKLGSITVNDSTTNPFQQNLRFRGFTASPLLGLPQGIAVHQNGVRINEPFGDTVQFDLIPDFAIETIQIIPGSNPVYGLNALGGAIGLQMKNGFNFQGAQAEVYGGAFGRYNVTGEYGTQLGRIGLYVGAKGMEEAGWREESHSDLVQIFGDLSYRDHRLEAGASLVYADTNLNGNGLAPIELLAVDREAVFTFPDNTQNGLAFFQSRGNYLFTDHFSLQGNAYYRKVDRETLNGDEGEFNPCESSARPPGAPANVLCEGGEGLAIIDISTGAFVTAVDAKGNGVFNRTSTATEGYGGSFQGTHEDRLFGLKNFFLLGTSIDFAGVDFASNTEIGSLTPNRTVTPTGIFIGDFEKAPNDELNTSLFSQNRFYGIYATNTLSLNQQFHLTVAGRFNHTRIKIFDNFGGDLGGNHVFKRFNPAVGATYKFSDNCTAYASLGRSSRSPTAAELSCADPEKPCRVPNAFIADPSLDQVVSRSLEIGARGYFQAFEDRALVNWSVATFHLRNFDDIIFVASPKLIGMGFFQNAGTTERLGVELAMNGSYNQVNWYANYSFIQATFESNLIFSNDHKVNSAANEQGELAVEPGDRLPGVPLHTAKIGVACQIRPGWKAAVESIIASSQIFIGDEGNDQANVSGYGIVNLRLSHQINDNFEVFAIMNNLFNHQYETFGALAEVEVDLVEVPKAGDPRFLGPGAPFGAWAGLRARF